MRGRLLLVCLCTLCISGCCCEAGHAGVYSIQYNGITIDWADPVEVGGPPRLLWVDVVFYGVQIRRRERELIEVYDYDGRRLVFVGEPHYDVDVLREGGCPPDLVRYDLSALPDGDYLLVHPVAAAPEGIPLEPRGPLVDFRGESAWVVELHRGSLASDAGSADAGM